MYLGSKNNNIFVLIIELDRTENDGSKLLQESNLTAGVPK